MQAADPSIYETPADSLSDTFFTHEQLSAVLRHELVGTEALRELSVRTRSKVAKSLVCTALGYRVPPSFKKTQPRLRHANIDVYVQQSNNLQIWNQEVDSARRYVILVLDSFQTVSRIVVIAGADLAQFDLTGILTSKFQANRIDELNTSRLVSQTDTATFIALLQPTSNAIDLSRVPPTALPEPKRVITIDAIFQKLLPVVGQQFPDPGATQERNRGTAVHRRACELLELGAFADNGQFPDILCQALEVKLQLARTIDLGLELPNSGKAVASMNGLLSVRDMRYAIFYGDRRDGQFEVTSLVVVTGEDFFKEFRQFGGNVSNSKLQLRLPQEWFSK